MSDTITRRRLHPAFGPSPFLRPQAITGEGLEPHTHRTAEQGQFCSDFVATFAKLDEHKVTSIFARVAGH